MSSVLIIEAEPWLGDHFKRQLSRAGFDTVLALHAYAAMDAINETRPDVIAMSLLLSGTSGLTLLHELQSYADTATIPIIVWSDRAAELSLDELSQYGVRRLLDTATMKPEDLPAAVRSVLHAP